MNAFHKLTAIVIILFSIPSGYGQCAPDTTPPEITCSGNITVACPHIIGNTFSFQTSIAPVTSDNCGAIVSQTYILTGATNVTSPATGINDATSVTFLAGTTTVTYTVTDGANNSASCSFTVTINDFTQPAVICPSDKVFSTSPGLCYAEITETELGFPQASDNCNGILTTPSGITLIDQPDPLPNYYEFPIGTTTVTWNVSDRAGNSSTCSQTVTVNDTEIPIINCASSITINTDTGQCDAYVNVPVVTATDNCTINSITNSYNGNGADASGTFPIGTTMVTFTATDSSNNVATCSINITVTNTQNPTITLIGANPLTIEACNTFNDPGATANDPCIGDITANIVTNVSGLDNTTVGTYTVIYEVTGANGNTSQITRTVNVVDSVSPSLTLIGPNPLTVGDCSTYTELGATALDGCLGDISEYIVVDNSSIDTSILGTYTVNYNVTDTNGNVASTITRTVNVVDSSPPEIILLGDSPQTIEVCTPYNELGATAIDPCFGVDYSSDIVIDASSIDTSTVGVYPVTYNVIDSNGNVAIEIIRNVEVIDTTMPTITCPSNIAVNNDPGNCFAVVAYTEPVGTDNCPVTTIQTSGLSSGSAFPIGTTTNTFEVTDENGNSQSCSFDVIVTDSEVPTAICASISLVLDPLTGNANVTSADLDNGSSDNCSYSISVSQSSFDCSDLGDNTVILTITDVSGNQSTCSAIVTITDLAQNASVNISTPTSVICQNESVTFTAVPTNGGTSPMYQWQLNGVDVPGEISDTYVTTSLNNTDEVTVVMTSSASVCAEPVTSNSISMSISDYNPPADAGMDITNTICTNTIVNLAGSAIVGSGSIGTWSVTSGQTTGFNFSDIHSPNSTFSGDIGETYLLTWSIDNPEPCPDTSDDVIVTFIGCSALDFDGVDDNITFRNNFNLNGDFTIELWMKSEVSNSNIQTLLSKRDATNLMDGFDLRIVDNFISFNWNNGESLTSNFQIVTNQWHHVSVTFNGSTYGLYIDGIEVASTTGVSPIANSVDCILGAMDQTSIPPFKPLNYFDGGMDELRIWDVALTEHQIRSMMNQEIEVDSGNIMGSTIPISISGVSWSNLIGYYQMNQNTDIVAGDLISTNNNSIDGVLRYMTTLQPETAPIPYQSAANGDWNNTNTWLHGNVQAIPNSFGIDGTTPINWNIVETAHNVSSSDRDLVLLGLNVLTNTLTIQNNDPSDGQSLRITDYLILNGVLDLQGESQLLQDDTSIVDYSGSGSLQRDQQGTSNLYNYNYWGSPVSSDGLNFTVGSVLYDGSVYTNPQVINWVNSYDATGTTNPISLSQRWIYTFEDSPGDNYYDWVFKGPNVNINVGQGFTLKGSGVGDPITDSQNYVFIGQPNNGTIGIPMIPTYQALIGNPYPSAIDANKFIIDNGPTGTDAIEGTLYFWEHSTTNISHILSEYEGGYSTYNLSGGLPAASAPEEISGIGSANKIPGRYIPVAQGFYVTSSSTGGITTFNNQQRIFVKEMDGNSIFTRPNQNSQAITPEPDLIQRVRLNFKSSDGFKRPLLLAFTPNNAASDAIDYGYDAKHTENFQNDASFIIAAERFVIQGVGEFNETSRYPLDIMLSDSGIIKLGLDDLENFELDIDVFVYDSMSNNSYQINTADFSFYLEAGHYENRFFITFQPSSSLDIPEISTADIMVAYLESTHEIFIRLPKNIEIHKLHLINLLGQTIFTWDQNDLTMHNNEIRIPIKTISEATYIINLTTSTNQTVNKKVFVRY